MSEDEICKFCNDSWTDLDEDGYCVNCCEVGELKNQLSEAQKELVKAENFDRDYGYVAWEVEKLFKHFNVPNNDPDDWDSFNAFEIIRDHLANSTAITDGWQGIETAPKDGTEIDIWFTGGFRIADCAWSGDGWYSDNCTDIIGHNMLLDSFNPTCFRPLPPAPSEKT